MLIALGVILLVAVLHLGDAVLFGKRIRHTEITYASAAIPKALEGYRMALITDTHDVLEEDIDKMCQYLDENPVDIVLLGGDHEASTVRFFDRLQAVSTRDGVWGVQGNHDDFDEWLQEMETHGFRPLVDEGIHIHDGFYLAGITDLWTNKADVSAALEDALEGDFVLMLSHNPDVAMAPESKGAHLQFSGHTHGGQITFFGLFKPGLYFVSNYGHRFGGGWANVTDGPDTYVSYGAGYDASPFYPRVFAHPELVVFTLRPTH